METTQYIVLSGQETSDDVPRVLGKIKLPNPVSISYRHATTVSDEFVEPLVKTLCASGVREVSTIFAEKHNVEQISRFGLENSVSVLER